MQWVSMAWGRGITQRPTFWPDIYRQDYSTLSSAFWRVIRQVVGELQLADIDDVAWPSCLTWSNLYKISPATGGNPEAKLLSLQRKDCIALLEAELQTYRPRRLLFLTGYDYALTFLKRLAPDVVAVRGSQVKAVGTTTIGADDRCAVVVATHPQSKPETVWVQEVLQAFRSQQND